MPRRPKRLRARPKPPHSVQQILAWADAFREATGRWPQQDSGPIAGTLLEKWHNVDLALRKGYRGLPGGSSLAQLLAEHRGKRNGKRLPHLSLTQVLAWADAYCARHGRWPRGNSGPIEGAPGETWRAVDMALRDGCRGFPGGTTLRLLLAERRGVRHRGRLPKFDVPTILAWADAHRERTGVWPTVDSGPVAEAPGETWCAVHSALAQGYRGLPGGTTLAALLLEHLGVRPYRRLPPLSEAQVLGWADAYHARTGRWPMTLSGDIPEAPGLTWLAVHLALKAGQRGLPGGTTLARFLVGHGRGRNRKGLPPLTIEAILAWADRHLAETGTWPKATSGPVRGAPGETWMAVQIALQQGRRGLPGGTTLLRLLTGRRGAGRG
jgi:hypothetical protein